MARSRDRIVTCAAVLLSGVDIMPQFVELPDVLADALADEASRMGLTLPDYAVRLLTSARPSASSVRTGADLVAFWRAEGLVGCRPAIADSQAHARLLREYALRRYV